MQHVQKITLPRKINIEINFLYVRAVIYLSRRFNVALCLFGNFGVKVC